jgi:hypothetical protein
MFNSELDISMHRSKKSLENRWGFLRLMITKFSGNFTDEFYKLDLQFVYSMLQRCNFRDS